MSSGKRDWILSQQAFDRLLERLDPDRERAGLAYEQVRRRLITFFQCRQVHSSEDCADETLNRVSRRLNEDRSINEIYTYLIGVARLVSKEALRSGRRERQISEEPRIWDAGETDRAEIRSQCFRDCLGKLPPQSRDLLREYYEGDWQTRVRQRRIIASRLGATNLALRIRIHRIREGLARCAGDCVRRRADS